VTGRRIQAYAAASRFIISSVVVGNVQYPAEVADAVARKLVATQELERKDTEIAIERKERTKREIQATGLAASMQIIRGQLTMSDVSIIGLGAMGAALARALMRGGHGVVVWNRTQARAEPLVHEGATLAADAAAAVAASPVVIVCVNDYEVTRDILSVPAVRAALSGRVLVQLSTGTPNDARAGAQWAQESGAEYLDGAILAYPDQMGTPDAALLVAGLGLIRFGGHLPKGGYDVPTDDRDSQAPAAPPAVR
jgi:phosphoglycerate dehydrogenase-like enzyme